MAQGRPLNLTLTRQFYDAWVQTDRRVYGQGYQCRFNPNGPVAEYRNPVLIMGEDLVALRLGSAPMASRILAALMPSSRCVMAVITDCQDRSAPCGSVAIWANLELHANGAFAVAVSRDGGTTWVSLMPADEAEVSRITGWWQHTLLGRAVAIYLFTLHEDANPAQVGED